MVLSETFALIKIPNHKFANPVSIFYYLWRCLLMARLATISIETTYFELSHSYYFRGTWVPVAFCMVFNTFTAISCIHHLSRFQVKVLLRNKRLKIFDKRRKENAIKGSRHEEKVMWRKKRGFCDKICLLNKWDFCSEYHIKTFIIWIKLSGE